LRSRTPDGVLQEVWAHLLVHYALRRLMHQAAAGQGLDPDRLSFTRTLRIVRRQVLTQAAFPPDRTATAVRWAIVEILLTALHLDRGEGDDDSPRWGDAPFPDPGRPGAHRTVGTVT
jgi:hypothetical protein